MAEKADIDRYQRYGWDYEAFNPISPEEYRWYLSWARKSGGPVLELACGTGRLLGRIAEAGFRCKGVDASPAMLDLARRNRGRLKPGARKRMSLKKADMRSFRLKGKYGLAILADNSFRVLSSQRQQRECLESVRRHLRPRGVFLMTVRKFDKAKMNGKKGESGWSKPICNPTTGHGVSRKVVTRVNEKRNEVVGEYRYKTIGIGGRKKSHRFSFNNPIMDISDYTSLLSDAGFKSRVYGNYRMRPPGGDTRMLCMMARIERSDFRRENVI
jgi:ubiquinone/menaquinone biosynthesis C-methylase UbiE